MTPAQARAMYRRQIVRHGETVGLLRAGTPTSQTDARARVLGYDPKELVGEIQQGDTKVILLAEDVGAFPVPFRAKSTDSIIVGGVAMKIQAVDDRTRRVAGVLIAYEIRVRG